MKTTKKLGIALFLLLCGSAAHADYLVSTIAGTGTSGSTGDGGAATSAQIGNPYGVAVDSTGAVYFADYAKHTVRKIDASGIITRVAGTGFSGFAGDGVLATTCQLSYPYDVAVDSSGNVYIADYGNGRIRKISIAGIISTIAGGGASTADGVAATSASLSPRGVAVDAAGNVYVADTAKIRKVSAAGIITTVAGTGTAGYAGDDGLATAAKLNYPAGLALDASGSLYVADTYNHMVRKISASGTITKVAGSVSGGFSGDGGLATYAQLYLPYDVAVDTSGNVYAADANNNRIRKVTAAGIITTFAGGGSSSSDGVNATAAYLYSPRGIAADASGNLYISDTNNYRIKKAVSGASAGADFSWNSSGSMSMGREEIGTAVVGGKIYIAGGYNGSTQFALMQQYDPVTSAWNDKNYMTKARTALGVAAVNGIIYAIGGWNGNSVLNTVEAFDPATNTWTTKSSMPTARCSVAAAVVGNKIYVIGGTDKSQAFSTVEVYDPATDSWSTKMSMPTPRHSLSAAVAGGMIYAIGGANTSYLATVEMYDPATNSWVSKKNMNTARDGMQAAVVGNNVYVIGGYNGSSCLTTVEEYNPAVNTWNTRTALSTARAFGAANVVDGAIYLLGGISYWNSSLNSMTLNYTVERGQAKVPLLSWPSDYGSAGVYPASGSQSTNFSFKVKYSHLLGKEPAAGYPKLHLFKNGAEVSVSPLSYRSGTALTGKEYSYETRLSTGSYSYYYEAYDTDGVLAIGDASLTASGPEVTVASDGETIQNAHAYPVPAFLGRGQRISFTDLPPNAVVTVMGPDGHILKKLFANDQGYIDPWNGMTDNGTVVASGVYIAHARAASGHKKIFKIMVIR